MLKNNVWIVVFFLLRFLMIPLLFFRYYYVVKERESDKKSNESSPGDRDLESVSQARTNNNSVEREFFSSMSTSTTVLSLLEARLKV